VLPDIGGHVYTCLDKISGKPMFYANPSIKKANIGYRGAWAAFGIEFNFPVSHNWVSMSPVDFAFGKHRDGSASVTVGNIDRVYGMDWTVELILRPKSTVLEERVTLSNLSDVRHRFYWWNNAGVEVWEDSRIEYPMRFTATHGFTDIEPWPVDRDGSDLSIIRNQTKGPVSLFAHGSREPFMAVWNPKTNTGTVHFADYAELPAKKIWSWGVDTDGLDWRKALSDNDSAYVEIQGGLFRDQETYAFLEPRQTINFSEYWMPVRQIGGISRANLAGVLSLRRNSNHLIVEFNANQPVPLASIAITDGDKRLVEERANLQPETTWSRELHIPDPQRHFTFELHDAKGALLLRQTEGEYDWTSESEIHVGPQQADVMPTPDERTEDDWLQLGTQQELNGEVLLARETYRQALSRFPRSSVVKKASGRLATSVLSFDEAKILLESVRRRDTTDAEVSYYLGIAYDGLGDEQHARTMYEQAMLLPQMRVAASLRLAELLARKGELTSAARHLLESLRASPDDLRVMEELVAVEHALGNDSEANARAQEWLGRFPLSYFLREELGKSDLKHLANDTSRVLNIASEYIRLGLYQRALDVLSRHYPSPSPDQSESGALPPEKHPLVAYFRGYCREKLGQSGLDDSHAASKLPTSYIFPNSAQELAVLKAGLQANPNDATAHYLLGTLYFSRGLTDAALEQWSAAQKLNTTIPVLDASRGLALLRMKNDPQQALVAFRDGLRSDLKNVAIYFGLDQALSILARPAQERVEALQQYPDSAEMPSDLVFELILNLAEAGDYERATALFHNRFFPREEGGTNVRQVWIEVQLQRSLRLAEQEHCAEALTVAGQLASPVEGLSFTNEGLEPILKSPRIEYLRGSIFSRCGKLAEAKGDFQAASAAPDPNEIVWAWLAAQRLPEFDQSKWRKGLESSLSRMDGNTESSPWRLYTVGSIQRALDRKEEASATFRKVFLLPDHLLVYHLTRLAQSPTMQ
jgi:tetratricopeptide (TPR) repeat protein